MCNKAARGREGSGSVHAARIIDFSNDVELKPAKLTSTSEQARYNWYTAELAAVNMIRLLRSQLYISWHFSQRSMQITPEYQLIYYFICSSPIFLFFAKFFS